MKKSLFLFCLNLSFSQTGYIQGIILSENMDTLAGANIAIDGTDIGTASMADGSFILNDLEPGKYVINVNYIGLSVKNVFESQALAFPLSPPLLRSFEIEVGYRF